ncbi:MAG: universal stress protein [Alphaproteobacteria bacterium]
MSYKELLVHVDRSRHCEARLTLAIKLAQRFHAHLTMLHVLPPTWVSPFLSDRVAAEVLEEADAYAARERAALEARFKEQAAGLETEWCCVHADAGEALSLNGRHADLTVLSQVDPIEAKESLDYDVPERVALGAGRPVLLLPYAAPIETIGERVLVAWNGSPQAARAVGDALPFLAGAKAVEILAVNFERGSQAEVSSAEIARYLTHHGINASTSSIEAEGVGIGERILAHAAD